MVYRTLRFPLDFRRYTHGEHQYGHWRFRDPLRPRPRRSAGHTGVGARSGERAAVEVLLGTSIRAVLLRCCCIRKHRDLSRRGENVK